jgi:hypothetical protein
MNSTTTTTQNVEVEIDCESVLYYKIIFVYGGRVTYYTTVTATLICTIVFGRLLVYNAKRRNDNKSQMYKYFFVRSILDFIAYVTTLPEVDYYNGINNINGSFMWQLWLVWIYYYLFYIVVSVSNYMEVAATLDCYLMIKNKLLFLLTSKTFNIILIILTVFNIVLNIHFIFMFNIIQNNGTINETTIGYTTVDSNYVEKSYYNGINTFISIYREVLPLLFLLVLNFFILKVLKEASARKKRLQNNNNNTASSSSNSNIKQAELNKIKMILAVSFSYIVLRVPFAIHEMALNPKNLFWECYYYSTSIRLYDISFGIQIFIYYLFNKKFRDCLLMTLKLKSIAVNNENTVLQSVTRFNTPGQ